MEAICNFWVLNGDSAIATTLWDTVKSWTRGEYISRISALQREAARSLEELERGLLGVRQCTLHPQMPPTT